MSTSHLELVRYDEEIDYPVTTPSSTGGAMTRFFRKVALIFSPAKDMPPDDDQPVLAPMPAIGRSVEKPDIQTRRVVVNRRTAERARIRAYMDYEDIDLQVPEASRALDIVAENATSNDRGDPIFELIYSDEVDEESEQQGNDVTDRLQLREKQKPICRSTDKYGDSFAELVPDENGDIVKMMPRYQATMFRVHDKYGNLLGYYQKLPHATMGDGPDETNAIWFPTGAIVHWRANPEWGARYGRSMLRSARFFWRHLQAMTDSIVANRITRGVQRYKFRIPVDPRMPPDKRREYMKQIMEENAREPLVDENGCTDVRTLARADAENVYCPVDPKTGHGDVGVLEGSNTLGQVQDARWIHRRFLVIFPVPPSYLSIEEDVNSKSTLKFEDIQHARFIRTKQKMELAPPIERIIRLQWALKGKTFGKNAVRVVFAPPSILDEELRASIQKIQAQTAAILANEVGVPMWFILRHVLKVPKDVLKVLDAFFDRIPQAAPASQDDDEQANGGDDDNDNDEETAELLRRALAKTHDLNAIADALRLRADYERERKPQSS